MSVRNENNRASIVTRPLPAKFTICEGDAYFKAAQCRLPDRERRDRVWAFHQPHGGSIIPMSVLSRSPRSGIVFSLQSFCLQFPGSLACV
ncbi:MAG: hypothetical protein AAFX40_07430 [Cyanobacteria bacterium J06639_1]